ncbi:MAG: transposase [Hyphomicrobiaceae bacterium]|nr:transposase [Hyphomicrobium sp.]NOT72656.1 transposase [Hyphomicrobium sp.]
MAQDRYVHSDDHSDITKPARPRRIEVLSGDDRRRKWPDEAKIAIVAEALADGAVVSRVARLHDLTPSQLFGWIKTFRTDALQAVGFSGGEPAMFARAVVDVAPVQPAQPAPAQAGEASAIEISFGTATVRIRGAADAKTLALVLKALKVLA